MSYRPRWQKIYEVDFTSLSTQNLLTGGDGSKTIDGKTWTATNTSNASTMSVTSGTGIVITCNSNNSSGNPVTRTAPMLGIPLNNIFTYNIERDIVRVMLRITSTLFVNNTEGCRLGIEDVTSPLNQAFSLFKGTASSTSEFLPQNSISGAGTSFTPVTTNFSDDVLSLTFEAPKLYEFRSGVFGSSAFPFSVPNFIFSEAMNMANPLLYLSSEPVINFSVQSGNTAGTVTTTFTHMKVDICKKN